MVTPRAPTGVPMLVCGRAVLVPCGRTPPRRYSGFVVVVTVGGAAVPRQSAIFKMAAMCSDGRGKRPLFFFFRKKSFGDGQWVPWAGCRKSLREFKRCSKMSFSVTRSIWAALAPSRLRPQGAPFLLFIYLQHVKGSLN